MSHPREQGGRVLVMWPPPLWLMVLAALSLFAAGFWPFGATMTDALLHLSTPASLAGELLVQSSLQSSSALGVMWLGYLGLSRATTVARARLAWSVFAVGGIMWLMGIGWAVLVATYGCMFDPVAPWNCTVGD